MIRKYKVNYATQLDNNNIDVKVYTDKMGNYYKVDLVIDFVCNFVLD